MLKPVICKHTANMNENIKFFDQFLWAWTRCNQECMLINYGKLILGKGAKIKKIIKFIHKNGANITIRILSINSRCIIYARKKVDIFMKCLYLNSFIKLDSFYDQRIEVTLSESIHGFSTKDIYIQQKAMFIISYIYQKTIVKENCSYCQQKLLFVIDLQIQQKVMFIVHL